MRKKRVLVIFGGPSMEYYAACNAMAGFIDYIDRELFEVLQIGITPKGEWLLTKASSEEINDGEKWMQREDNKRAVITPMRDEHCILVLEHGIYTEIPIDIVFPYVVGYGGEDGKIPGLLDLNHIPYVGCGVASSACGMDKELTRLFADACGLKQPDCTIINKSDYEAGNLKMSDLIPFGYPAFVKPANGGTSVGVSRVVDEKELIAALDDSFQYDEKTLIEQEIVGTEIKVAVLGNDKLEYGALCEIIMPRGTVNDYETKQTKGSKKEIPAKLEPEIEAEIKRQTEVIYKKMGCRGFARVDFFLTDENEIYFNEINTVPGLGKTSIYSIMFEKVNVPLTELLTKLILTALN